MFRSWLREDDAVVRRAFRQRWWWGLLSRSSTHYLGADSTWYTRRTLPLALAVFILGGRTYAYRYLFPDLKGLKGASAPVAVRRLLADIHKRPNTVRLAAAIAAPALDRLMVERGRKTRRGYRAAMERAEREKGMRYAVSDAEQADLVSGMRRIREDYPYGAEILTFIAKAQDSLHKLSPAETCAVLEIARRTLATYVAAAEVGQAVRPGVDAHMALRMNMAKHRGEVVQIVDVAAAFPHLSFRDFKRAARTLASSFPKHVIYSPSAFTVQVTAELPPDFMISPLRGVSATAIMPTPIAELERLTAKMAKTFRLTGPHAAPTIASRHRTDPPAYPTAQPTGPDDVETTARHAPTPPVSG